MSSLVGSLTLSNLDLWKLNAEEKIAEKECLRYLLPLAKDHFY